MKQHNYPKWRIALVVAIILAGAFAVGYLIGVLISKI